MKTKKWILITLAFAIVGFLMAPATPIGEKVWGAMPNEPGSADPTAIQLTLLLVVGVVESCAFGLGCTLLLFGRGAFRRWGTRGAFALGAVAWGLVSWVPHTAMHATNGDDLGRLILIEYVFHVTLILAAAGLAWFLVQVARETVAGTLRDASPRPDARPIQVPPARRA